MCPKGILARAELLANQLRLYTWLRARLAVCTASVLDKFRIIRVPELGLLAACGKYRKLPKDTESYRNQPKAIESYTES